MKKYKIYYRVKRKNSTANSLKLEININEDSFGKACDKLKSTILDNEPHAEIIIVEGFEQVYNDPESIVLPEDL